MVVASLERDPLTAGNGLLPSHPTLANYRLLLSSRYGFGLAIRNGLVVAGVASLVSLLLGALAGYALARLRPRGGSLVLGGLLALAMFPSITLVPTLFQLFSTLKWVDRFQAMIIPDLSFALPLMVWLLTASLAKLPWELEDAARVDGATRSQAFRKVLVPLAAPGVVAAALVVFVFVWNELLFALAMTLTPSVQPVTVALTRLPSIGGLGLAMAAGVLVALPVLGLVAILQRRITATLGPAPAEVPAARLRRQASRRLPGARRRQPRWRLVLAPTVAVLGALAISLVVSSSAPTPTPAARADDGARIVVVAERGPRLRDLTIASPALGRTATVRLLLPPSFQAEPDRRWPELWLLHGCCDTYQSWTRSTDVQRLPALEDILVVMPEAGQVGFYSDWENDGHGSGDPPRWETFHLTEVRQLLERNYRAGGPRAVAGLSMGGLGAMAYAARHPGMFQAAAAYSGILDTSYQGAPIRGSAFVLNLLRAFGEDPSVLWGDPGRRAAVWAAHNPYDLAARLRGVDLFVSVGNGRPGPLDGPAPTQQARRIEQALQPQTLAFVARLRQLHIPVQVDAYGPGTHDWPYWQRELHRSLPLLQRALRGR